MKLPDMVYVLDQEYKVHHKPAKEMKGYLGICKSTDMVIEVRNNMTNDKTKEVLLHEVTHAISDALNLNLTEDQVNNIGVGMYGFLSRNKIDWYKAS